MKLSNNSLYLTKIRQLESSLTNAVSKDELTKTKLRIIQERLDALAERYAKGSTPDSYRMYFLQAQLHYYSGEDEMASQFLDVAINERGVSWNNAELLREKLSARPIKRADVRYARVGGWLIIPVIVFILSSCMGIFRLIQSLVMTDYTHLIQYVGSSLVVLVDIIPAILYLVLPLVALFYILKKQRIAVKFSVISLFIFIVISWAECIFVAAIFDNGDAASEYVGQRFTGAVCLTLFYGLLGTYFLNSKRVDMTFMGNK